MLVAGIAVPQDSAVTVPSASFAEGRISGSNGCNDYSAEYTLDGASLELGPITKTQMACQPAADAVEASFDAALANVTGWQIEGEDLILDLDEGGEPLRFAPATLLGGWRATGLQQGAAFSSPVPGTMITAFFEDNGSVTGSGGCNTYAASFKTANDTIEIGTPASTKLACVVPKGATEQETAYLALLPRAASYRVDGSSLELLDAARLRLATFARTSVG